VIARVEPGIGTIDRAKEGQERCPAEDSSQAATQERLEAAKPIGREAVDIG
jgi:hypothetical protein